MDPVAQIGQIRKKSLADSAILLSPAAAQLVLSEAAPDVVAASGPILSPAAAEPVLSTTVPFLDIATTGDKVPVPQELLLSTAAPTVTQTTSADLSPDAAQLTIGPLQPRMLIVIPGGGGTVTSHGGASGKVATARGSHTAALPRVAGATAIPRG